MSSLKGAGAWSALQDGMGDMILKANTPLGPKPSQSLSRGLLLCSTSTWWYLKELLPGPNYNNPLLWAAKGSVWRRERRWSSG